MGIVALNACDGHNSEHGNMEIVRCEGRRELGVFGVSSIGTDWLKSHRLHENTTGDAIDNLDLGDATAERPTHTIFT